MLVIDETVHVELNLGDGHQHLGHRHRFDGVFLVKADFVDSDQVVRVQFENCLFLNKSVIAVGQCSFDYQLRRFYSLASFLIRLPIAV